MKILFLTTAHKYDDDRIFYHQAVELRNQGFEVKISSLCSDFQGKIQDIEIESYPIIKESSAQKTETFLKITKAFQPDCIIASEPLAVIAAGKFQKIKKTAIIYDITEWYPSFRMLQGFPPFKKQIQWFKFTLIQLWAGWISTHFIFGEASKKYPLGKIFPFKKSLMLPYYPDEKYIHHQINNPKLNEIKLCYTGRISEEDGIGHFFSAIDALRKSRPDIKASVLIVGAPKKETDRLYFENLLNHYSFKNLEIKKPVKFESFTESYADADLCFDLREKNAEYDRSLPIKIFYYMASGKPVIYTNLSSITKHLDIIKFGAAVDPKNSEIISKIIAHYCEHPDFYLRHARQARSLFENKYNWAVIKDSFVSFVLQAKR